MTVKRSWKSEYSQDVPKQMTELHLAAYVGVHKAVGSLFQYWQDVDLNQSCYGRAPLSYAAQKTFVVSDRGHFVLVSIWARKGDVLATVGRCTSLGRTARMCLQSWVTAGAAYVDGVMYGEARRRPRIRERIPDRGDERRFSHRIRFKGVCGIYIYFAQLPFR